VRDDTATYRIDLSHHHLVRSSTIIIHFL